MISTLEATGGGIGAGAALPFAGAAVTGALEYAKSSPHAIAKQFVDQFEGPFGQQLALAVQAKDRGDIAGAQQIFSDAYAKYWQGIQHFQSGLANYRQAAEQSLNNNALQSTIQTLAGQLGLSASNGSLSPVAGFSEQNPAASGGGNSVLDTVAQMIPGVLGTIPELQGGIGSPGVPEANPAAPPLPGAPPAQSGGGGIAGVLGKIFGIDTSKGTEALIAQLAKLGIPLTAAILNGNAASKAADTQAAAADRSAQLIADAAKNSLDFDKQVYNDSQTQTAPYREAGTGALDKIKALLGLGPEGSAEKATTELQGMPGYQLNLSEGMKALRNASKGIVSGATLKAADRFASDYSGNYLDKTLGQLDTVAGLGQTGTGQSLSSGANSANLTSGVNSNSALGIGNSGETAAAARASGYGNGAFSQVLNTLQKQQLLKELGL